MIRIARSWRFHVVVALALSMIAGTDALAAGKRPGRVAECTPAASAPKIDGKLDDDCWKTAPVMTDFLLDSGQGIAPDATAVKACFDKDNLYLGIDCPESDMSAIKATVKQDGGEIYVDDDIEIFFDPANDKKTCYQLAFNTLAARSQTLNGGQWACDWKVAVAKEKDRWTAEAAIPLKVLGEAKVGSSWGFNIGRGQPGRHIFASFAGITGKWSAPAQFATLKFVEKATGVGKLFEKRQGVRVWALPPQQALDLLNLPEGLKEGQPNEGQSAFGTPGEVVPYTVHVLNLEASTPVKFMASATEFTGPDGAKLPVPASSWLYLSAKMAGGYATELLGEGDTVTVPAGQRGGFWLDFRIPADAKPGLYTGGISLTGYAPSHMWSVPLRLLVLPFTLDANPTSCGFHTPKDRDDKMLQESMKLMREHGMTTFAPYGGWGGVGGVSKYVELRKQYGFAGKAIYADTCMYVGDTLARDLKLPKQGPASLQKGRCFVANDEFKKRYVAEMKKYYDEAVRVGAPDMSFSIGDELTNDGYYAALHSIDRARILREGLPKMVLTTDTNGYTEAVGCSKYLNCVGVNDGWDGPDNHNGGRRILTPPVMKEIRDNGCGIEFVNTGTDRFPYGLYLWRMTNWGVQSKIEWIWHSDRHEPGWLNVWREEVADGKPTGKHIIESKPPAQWKTFVTVALKFSRMGTYDTRYMATLEKLVKETGDAAAKAFLDDVTAQIPIALAESRQAGWEAQRCDVVRWQAAEHIMRIKKTAVGVAAARPAAAGELALDPASKWSTAEPDRKFIRHKARTISCAAVDEAPAMDGKLDDKAWAAAQLVTGAYRDSDLSLVEGMMTLRAVYTDAGVYLGIASVEPQPEKMAFSAKGDGDPNLWQADDIEIFVQTDPKPGADYYHLIYDAKGARSDYKKTELGWKGEWKVACRLEGKLWTSTVFLPFASLGSKDQPWRIFVGRGSPTRNEYYGITPIQGSWHDVSQFATMQFAPKGAAPAYMHDIEFGALKTGPNTLALKVANPGKEKFDGKVAISLPDGQTAESAVSVAAGKSEAASVPFDLKTAGAVELTVALKDSAGKALDSQTFLAQVPELLALTLDAGSVMTFERTIRGTLAVNLPRGELAGMSLHFQLIWPDAQRRAWQYVDGKGWVKNPTGYEPPKPYRAKLEGNRLEFTIKLPDLPEGKYKLTAALTKDGRPVAEKATDVFLADAPSYAAK
ncbi:MAG: sugar-binding protein [Phycisphaerae bacterium]